MQHHHNHNHLYTTTTNTTNTTPTSPRPTTCANQTTHISNKSKRMHVYLPSSELVQLSSIGTFPCLELSLSNAQIYIDIRGRACFSDMADTQTHVYFGTPDLNGAVCNPNLNTTQTQTPAHIYPLTQCRHGTTPRTGVFGGVGDRTGFCR